MISSEQSQEAEMQRPQQNIIAGTILVRRSTELPAGLHVATTGYVRDWEIVDNGDGLEALLLRSGWNLFFIAGALRSMSLGTGDRSTRKGVSRLLAQIRPLSLNSMKVTHIASKTFLGIPYQVLLAHPCHIQQGCVLASKEARKNSLSQPAMKLTPALLPSVPSIKVTETS